MVCGDSHTATHGAFGALAFGIGTSEVEHVLATQTLRMKRPKNMRISVEGDLPNGVTAKDLVLAVIGAIGTAGGTGHVIEYAGPALSANDCDAPEEVMCFGAMSRKCTSLGLAPRRYQLLGQSAAFGVGLQIFLLISPSNSLAIRG